MTEPQAASPKPQAVRRWFLVTVVILAVCGFALAAAPAIAQVNTGLEFGTATGLSTQDIRVSVAKVIRAALGLLGIIALGVVLAGGFLWMTSGGEEEKITRAKRLLGNGAIGLAIILTSFSITQFVLSRLLSATSGSGTVASAGGGFGEDVFLSGALGAGPVESHYPTRGGSDIPRNVRIFITFREPVDPASLALDTNGNGTIGTVGDDPRRFDNYRDLARPEAIAVAAVSANVDATRITPLARQQDAAAFTREAGKLVAVGVALSSDRKTVVLAPVEVRDGRVATDSRGYARRALLGSAEQPVAYLVRLTSEVKAGARRADGAAIDLFTGAFRDGYTWDFTVTTTADTTPPTITGVVPLPDPTRDRGGEVEGQPDQPRNVMVQVTFSEPMDPTVTSGSFAPSDPAKSFTHVSVAREGAAVAGTFTITNGYRTVEFRTDAACGQNSCGGTVYCLPGGALIGATVGAARLDAGGPSGIPFTGVTDAAGNSLDGNRNGRAEGPGAAPFDLGNPSGGGGDSARWTFATTDTLDLTAPVIREVVHYTKRDEPFRLGAGVTPEDVSLVKPVEVLFTKLMSGEVTTGLHLTDETGCDAGSGRGCLWHSGRAANEDTDADRRPDATRVLIDHATLREAQAGQAIPRYRVRVDSTVRDLYQNCFFTVGDPGGPTGPRGGERCVTVAGVERCEPVR